MSVTVLALCAGVLNAATIHVPADQSTIQAGIDAASVDWMFIGGPGPTVEGD